jgi:hypothetical protein
VRVEEMLDEAGRHNLWEGREEQGHQRDDRPLPFGPLVTALEIEEEAGTIVPASFEEPVEHASSLSPRPARERRIAVVRDPCQS